MISNEKARPLIIIIIGIIFAFIPIFISNSRFTAKDHDIFSNYNDEFDYCNLKISTVSGKIYIDNINLNNVQTNTIDILWNSTLEISLTYNDADLDKGFFER